MEYREVQEIAKKTMDYIQGVIVPGMALPEIRSLCEEKMRVLGADSFWYWDVGAFVFAGEETALSVSGRGYRTSKRVIGENDIITIDLSPQVGDIWGDYARTLIVENGRIVRKIDAITNEEWREGLKMEEKLHEELRLVADPAMTFEDFYFHMNDFIWENGFVNLDFLGNLGHSIVRRKEDRIYIEKGSRVKLGDAGLFTFEPHIGKAGSKYGYKKENIYCFENGILQSL